MEESNRPVSSGESSRDLSPVELALGNDLKNAISGADLSKQASRGESKRKTKIYTRMFSLPSKETLIEGK